MDFRVGTGFKAGQVAVVNHTEFGTLKPLQTLTADLQKATSDR